MALKIQQKFVDAVTRKLTWLPKKAVMPLAAAIVLVPAITALAFSYGPLVSVEPENGSLSGGTTTVADGNASGGQSVKFQTSDPEDCPNAPHTPGGDDGQGGCWPYAGNTGVPAGTTLTNYTGPTTITTPNTIINAKTVNDDLVIQTTGVQILNSRVNGHIDVDGANRSVTIEDSEINAGNVSQPAVGYGNLTIRRTNLTGGQHSVLCGDNCVMEDNYMHAQYNAPGGSYHNNAFISNGGSGATLTHNTFFCEPENNGSGGGCTADVSFFGDFAVISDITVNNNLFVATPSGAYCGSFGHNPAKPFGSNPSNVVVTNNIFQRGPNNQCGTSAPVTSFLSANGNVWTNNKWDDGATVPPADD